MHDKKKSQHGGDQPQLEAQRQLWEAPKVIKIMAASAEVSATLGPDLVVVGS
jgi:hypothetical protein